MTKNRLPKHKYAELYALYEAERETVCKQNDVITELRDTIDKIRADLRHREANDKLSQEAFKSAIRGFNVQQDRCRLMRQHIEIALRVLRRGKVEKKKVPALRRALAVLEAAMAEDKDHDWPAWAIGAAAATMGATAAIMATKTS